MTDLEYGPEDFVFLLSFVGGVFGIFHLIAELEQGIFEIVKASGRRLAIARRADGRHFRGIVGGTEEDVLVRWVVKEDKAYR